MTALKMTTALLIGAALSVATFAPANASKLSDELTRIAAANLAQQQAAAGQAAYYGQPTYNGQATYYGTYNGQSVPMDQGLYESIYGAAPNSPLYQNALLNQRWFGLGRYFNNANVYPVNTSAVYGQYANAACRQHRHVRKWF
jgi:hypothetical protein